ncbi:MAG: prepilin-type N-terminal cleavage/methylation domain-containing protein [Desulfatitalea sp.]
MWIRPRRGPNRRSNRGIGGFTLLEILVAMSIFAIVMALIFGTFEGVFSNADHVTRSSALFEMADACLGRIATDLQATHVMQTPRYKKPEMDSEPDIYRIEAKNETMGDGTFTQLRFASLAHLPIGGTHPEGIAEIVYYAQELERGEYILRRADHPYPYPEKFEPKKTDPILCEQVRSFKLLFYDKEGREQEEWDSEDDDFEYSTPAAVKVELTLGSEESPYEFSTIVTLPMQRFIEPKR